MLDVRGSKPDAMTLDVLPRGNVGPLLPVSPPSVTSKLFRKPPPWPHTRFPIYFSLLSGIITCTLQRMTRRTKGPFAIIRIKGTGLLNMTVGTGSGYTGDATLRAQRRRTGRMARKTKGRSLNCTASYQCTAGTVWYWDTARPIPTLGCTIRPWYRTAERNKRLWWQRDVPALLEEDPLLLAEP